LNLHSNKVTSAVTAENLADVPCADLLKVLADETRLGVVQQLMQGPRRVAQINASLEIEPTLLSHHLKVLREAGILESRRQGKSVEYRLAAAVESKRRGAGLDLGCCRLEFK
jgi:ArsR family transcriptional regulator